MDSRSRCPLCCCARGGGRLETRSGIIGAFENWSWCFISASCRCKTQSSATYATARPRQSLPFPAICPDRAPFILAAPPICAPPPSAPIRSKSHTCALICRTASPLPSSQSRPSSITAPSVISASPFSCSLKLVKSQSRARRRRM